MRIPALKARQLIRILGREGFIRVRQTGSHILFKHPDGRSTLVPYHSGEDLERGLMMKILKEDVKFTKNDLERYFGY